MTALWVLALVATAGPERRAVVVGSNASVEGRATLRFAHHDAQNVATVLRQSGGFDVAVLLDPSPAEVVSALDSATTDVADDGLVVFYYSGHADERALFPGGAALPLAELKRSLVKGGAGARVGIIDACRGGGWTLAKGLKPIEPFEIGLPAVVSEGTALLASSSGLEDAHEAEALQGSFFTHHLVGGLRGAADQSGDGQVTLSEAFAYANQRTIRDTAKRHEHAQHPSFDVRLRGRHDVVLTALPREGAQLVVSRSQRSIEVVHLSTGVAVAESAGERLRLALVPGPYLVRVVNGGQVLASKEVAVVAGQTTTVAERELAPTASATLPTKGVTGAGREVVQVSVGLAPLDPYVLGLVGQVDVTHFFSSSLGWRVLRLAMVSGQATSLRRQLELDFGVVPTRFYFPELTGTTGLAWEPSLLRGAFELLATVCVGGGVMVGFDAGDGVRPALSVEAGLRYLFLTAPIASLGVDLRVSDTIGFGARLYHLASVTLGIAVQFGAKR